MKVLFVNHNISLWVNVGMTYVMSSAAQRHQVYLVDRMKHKRNFFDYLNKEIVCYKPNVVALSVNSYTIKEAILLARAIKRRFPAIKIVFGGVHPTIMPEETISLPEVDAICIGEGELSFLEYLDCIENDKAPFDIKGIWFKDNSGRVIQNRLKEFVEELDSLPLPNWDFWDIEAYMSDGEIVPGTLRVLTSRGCPFNCSFCTNPVWQRCLPGKYYRKRNPLKIIDEIEYNFHKYGSRGFKFLMVSDSIFGLDKSHGYEFCRLYKDKGLAEKLPWGAQIRCGTIDEGFAHLLREAGCRRITLSIESGNDYMRNEIYKKRLSRMQIQSTVGTLQNAGIVVRAFVMIGGPQETKSMFDETLSLVKNLNMAISDLIIIRYVPLPKTELASRINSKYIMKIYSPFCHPNLNAVRSKIPYYYYLKISFLKIYSLLKEGFSLKGLKFLSDVIKIIYKNGKTRFIPLIYLCSEQGIVNRTIAQYKTEKIVK